MMSPQQNCSDYIAPPKSPNSTATRGLVDTLVHFTRKTLSRKTSDLRTFASEANSTEGEVRPRCSVTETDSGEKESHSYASVLESECDEKGHHSCCSVFNSEWGGRGDHPHSCTNNNAFDRIQTECGLCGSVPAKCFPHHKDLCGIHDNPSPEDGTGTRTSATIQEKKATTEGTSSACRGCQAVCHEVNRLKCKRAHAAWILHEDLCPWGGHCGHGVDRGPGCSGLPCFPCRTLQGRGLHQTIFPDGGYPRETFRVSDPPVPKEYTDLWGNPQPSTSRKEEPEPKTPRSARDDRLSIYLVRPLPSRARQTSESASLDQSSQGPAASLINNIRQGSVHLRDRVVELFH